MHGVNWKTSRSSVDRLCVAGAESGSSGSGTDEWSKAVVVGAAVCCSIAVATVSMWDWVVAGVL